MVLCFLLIFCVWLALPARCKCNDIPANLENLSEPLKAEPEEVLGQVGSDLTGGQSIIADHPGQSLSGIARRASYHFDPLANGLNVVYYGQSNLTGNVSLTQICNDESIDVVILGVVKSFYGPDEPSQLNITLDLHSLCSGPTAAQVKARQAGLLDCVSGGFVQEIASCQKQGKKVLISAGSASGNLYMPNSKAASKVANMLWNLFLGGTDSTIMPLRPFGSVVLDGFDLDNENATNAKYLPNLISLLRRQLKHDKSKSYYLSAAPICALPDPEIPVAKLIRDIDFWTVQFYNAQKCQLGSGDGVLGALQDWSDLLLEGRKLKCTRTNNGDSCTVPKGKFHVINNGVTYPRLLIGTRAFFSAPDTGYVDVQTYMSILEQVKKLDLPNLAGATFWEGTYQYRSAEEVDGKNLTFAEVVRDVL
ncbi:hypothetical protein A1O3_07237 [Capronia epimyces CBS 606.96]|uniref:chitinase n=1 Tax=Capronia epimyces CBS 606.96 TaxID=1182542 RepID=W9YF80_9EURO|nr:uncharacterized protein A1O3_07237 [Capronia epimyces CBS 606.96]EXJ80949.1 hypothetical protein A1O3_07237 [Capronia epimyces CBS 606.96]